MSDCREVSITSRCCLLFVDRSCFQIEQTPRHCARKVELSAGATHFVLRKSAAKFTGSPSSAGWRLSRPTANFRVTPFSSLLRKLSRIMFAVRTRAAASLSSARRWLATAAMPPPLKGVKIVDLTRVMAGPYATVRFPQLLLAVFRCSCTGVSLAQMMLSDLGAEVIKVERPGSGDDTRSCTSASRQVPVLSDRL